ncbi:MAG: AMP-binding protein, partial [Woeseiaceae bacterium]
MRLHDALDKASAAQGGKVALCVCDKSVLTFDDLSVLSTGLAHGLARRGLKPGDRVGLVAGHSTAAVALFWAILKA